jgi:hypothetical protein
MQAPGQTRAAKAAIRPFVSVIIPLLDDRGNGVKAVGDWTSNQTYPRESFEVILASNGRRTETETCCQQLLGATDRLLIHDTNNELELLNVAASRARGAILVFTESHCFPRADLLEKVVHSLATTDHVGACTPIRRVLTNYVAQAEDGIFQRYTSNLTDSTNWRKAQYWCFAIRRQAYFDLGGYRPEFDLFAPMAFAALAREKGYPLGCATETEILHVNNTTLRETVRAIVDFIEGESLCRDCYPADFCGKHFGPPPAEWALRSRLRSPVSKQLCRNLVVSALKPGRDVLGTWASCLCGLARYLPAALFGCRPQLALSAVALRLGMLNCQLWRGNSKRLQRAYWTMYAQAVRQTRLRFISAHPLHASKQIEDAGTYDITDLPEASLVDFHSREDWESRPFRWSSSMAAILLAIPPGSYSIRIETGGLRTDLRGHPPRFFFDGNRLPASAVRFDREQVALDISESCFVAGRAEQSLFWTCAALKPWRHGVDDRRELGLPIFQLAIEPRPRPNRRLRQKDRALERNLVQA